MYDRKDEVQEKFSNLHEYTQQKEQEATTIETRLEELKHDYEPYKAQENLNLLVEVFPSLKERLRITQLCKGIRLAVDTIKRLFKGEAIIVTGKLYSTEHKESFSIQEGKLQLFKEKDNTDKLKLTLNGKNIIDWFRQMYREFQQSIGINVKSNRAKKISGAEKVEIIKLVTFKPK